MISRVLLFLIYLRVFTHCFNENSKRFSLSKNLRLIFCTSDRVAGNTQYSNSYFSCTNIRCRKYNAVIAGSIVGGGIVLISIAVCIIVCYRQGRYRPSQTNLQFVSSKYHENNDNVWYDINLFQSGIWSYRYLQLGTWHGPTHMSLSFDSQFLKITGSGADSTGAFTIDGTYSMKTGRVGLTKSYQFDAGNRLENSHRSIIIQLEWDAERRQFIGKQYVRNKKHREVNKFEMKLTKQQPPSSISSSTKL